MTARDEILARVRGALEGADRDAVAVPRGYRSTTTPTDRVSRFAERVADYKATVVRCGEADLAGCVDEALGAGRRVIVPEGLRLELPSATLDTGQCAVELDGFDAVVTEATVGIAETGTIVLTHGPGEGRRALTLVPDLHVCIVRADQVVASVPEAVAVLDPARPTTWISGPSATSDIELSRVEGVHGPRTLHVVLVG